jgi:hypothetical protein
VLRRNFGAAGVCGDCLDAVRLKRKGSVGNGRVGGGGETAARYTWAAWTGEGARPHYPVAGGEFQSLPGWLPEDIWITWSADGRSAYIYHDEKTSAAVYRLDVATGKRQLVATLAPGDPAGVSSIYSVRMTPDGKSSAYSFTRDLSDLFLVEGVR